MQELARILKGMQKEGSPQQADLIYGVVESVDPLSISVDSRFSISSDFIELGNSVKDFSTNPPTTLFEVGQTVRLIRYSQGQKYLALEIVDVESAGGGGTSDYEDLSNLPKLNTSHTSALLVQTAEIMKGVINLHRIAKTGNYNDLNDKPTIPTKLSELETDPNNQRVSETEKMNWITTSEFDEFANMLVNMIDYLEDYVQNHKHLPSGIMPGIFPDDVQSQRTHIADRRDVNRPPSWYLSNYPQSTIMELKRSNIIGLDPYATGALMVVQTIIPLNQLDPDYEIKQIAWGNNNESYYRTSADHSTWIPWTALNLGGFFPPV